MESGFFSGRLRLKFSWGRSGNRVPTPKLIYCQETVGEVGGRGMGLMTGVKYYNHRQKGAE